MGLWSHGILVYGFILKYDDVKNCRYNPLNAGIDSEGNGVEHDEDWCSIEDFIADLYSFPPEPFGGEHDYERRKTDPEYDLVWKNYITDKNARLDEIGVDLSYFGDRDREESCTDIILRYRGFDNFSNIGYPIHLGQQILPLPEWRQKILDFCQKANITFHEPELLLGSSYG